MMLLPQEMSLQTSQPRLGRLEFYGIAAEKVAAEELERAIDEVMHDLCENGVT
jgi:hypothetical protein